MRVKLIGVSNVACKCNPLPTKRVQGSAVSSPPPIFNFPVIGALIPAKIRDKVFNGGLL